MATVCAGSLALLDAGVPLAEPAAGVAIGLVTKYSENDPHEISDFRILTDILVSINVEIYFKYFYIIIGFIFIHQGIEDYLGDMDMKVAGTKKGMTAIQADIKTSGISMKIISEAVQRANIAKLKILDKMSDCILLPRTNRKECWPVTENLIIEPSQRASLIGPGGINIRKLFVETGAHLTQVDDTKFSIFAPSESAMNEVKEHIHDLLKVNETPNLEFGAIYTAKIVEIRDSGLMVTLYPTMKPALIHMSQLSNRKVCDFLFFVTIIYKKGDKK